MFWVFREGFHLPGRWCKMTSGLCKNKRLLSAFICAFVIFVYMGFQIIYSPVNLRICPEPKDSPEFYSNNNDDITIVTMYLNIGSLQKTRFWFFSHTSYTPSTYREWLLSWGKLENKVIAFFDDDVFINQFKLLRSHLPEEHTIVIKVDKTDLPAFEKMKQIEDIIKAPIFKVSYAPVYTCTMNAKYDALEKALSHVTTKYIAWMDIGLFRGFDMESPLFKLKPPPRFNDSNIGVSEVTPREEVEGLSPQDIYIKNIVWVAGGYILADKKILPDFISAYRKAVDELLALRLADTDQQVIGSMYSPYMVKSQKIFLEPYHCPRGSFGLFGHGYLYFCLPYICKESAECKSKYFSNTENHTEKLGRVLAS